MKVTKTPRHYLAAWIGLIMSLSVSSAYAACETQFKAWQDKAKNATPNTVKDAQQLEFAYNNCMKREAPPAQPAAPVPVYTPPKPTQAEEQRQAASRLDSCERTLTAGLNRGWQEQAAGYKVILDGNKTHSKAYPGKFDVLTKENGTIKVSLDGIKPAYSRDKKAGGWIQGDGRRVRKIQQHGRTACPQGHG